MWSCAPVCGLVRQCVVLCASVWSCAPVCGLVCLCVVLCACVWSCAPVCGLVHLSTMHLHVGVQLVFLGKRTTAQVAQMRAHARVHGAQVSAQHLAQQEAAPALAALEAALAAVRQHVARQLAAPRALPRTDVAYELLLLMHRVHVILISGVRLEHGSTQRTLHRSLLPHRAGRILLLLDTRIMRLFVDQTVHAQVERVLHATAALRALVRLRIVSHVHQQLLVTVETALANRALELIARDLQKSVFQIDGGLFRRLVRPRLERAHVVDAHVPAQLLNRRADLRTLGALERGHGARLVEEFRVEVQPVGRRALERRLLAAVHDALVALKTCDVAEAFTAVVTRLARWHHAMFLG